MRGCNIGSAANFRAVTNRNPRHQRTHRMADNINSVVGGAK